MTKQDIIRKLTSRKLWLAIGAIIATWVTPDVANEASAAITAVITAAYALAEGIADAGRSS